MSLTVKEKEHWKERIEQRIDGAIKQLKMSDKNNVLQQIEKEAEQKAKEALGIDSLAQKREAIDQQVLQLCDHHDDIVRQMTEKLEKHEKRFSKPYYYLCELPRWIQEQIDEQAEIYRIPLLKASEIGRKLLKLEREKEDLLDTVWLSTSTKQIKQLWSDVAEMLHIEQTELQKQAIAMEPVDSEAK